MIPSTIQYQKNWNLVQEYDGATSSFKISNMEISDSNKENISNDLAMCPGKVKQIINRINNMPFVSLSQMLISNIFSLQNF